MQLVAKISLNYSTHIFKLRCMWISIMLCSYLDRS